MANAVIEAETWLRLSASRAEHERAVQYIVGRADRGEVVVAINFTLWVFDVVGLTDVKHADIQDQVNKTFLANLKGDDISSANTKVVAADQVIAPGKNDAVVFLIRSPGFNGSTSLIKKTGGDVTEALSNQDITGLTDSRPKAGSLAEVYWDRCDALSGVATAIFHEAAHLKFEDKKPDEMHNSPGVRVLSKAIRNVIHPNKADLALFKKLIRKTVKLLIKVPV